MLPDLFGATTSFVISVGRCAPRFTLSYHNTMAWPQYSTGQVSYWISSFTISGSLIKPAQISQTPKVRSYLVIHCTTVQYPRSSIPSGLLGHSLCVSVSSKVMSHQPVHEIQF